MDSYRIEAGNETLFRQATSTADHYLGYALEDIDKRLGPGFAKAHPELIAAYMQTAAIDMGTAVIARAIEGVREAMDTMREAMEARDA